MNGKVALSEASSVEPSDGSAVHSAAVLADGTILLGTPRYGGGTIPGGRVSLLSLVPQSGGGYSFMLQGGMQATDRPRVGISVAAGFVTGAATGDFVAVSDGSVQVLAPDGKTVLASTDSPTSIMCPTVSLRPEQLLWFPAGRGR